MAKLLRERLVETALEWQGKYGVAPSITSTVSEDVLVWGMPRYYWLLLFSKNQETAWSNQEVKLLLKP